MLVNGQHFRTIWPDPQCKYVEVIDQTKLPFLFAVKRISSLTQMVEAIMQMQVRGAPLIGVSAAYGMALAMLEDDSDTNLNFAANLLIKSRPTAVNLAWAVDRMRQELYAVSENRNLIAWKLAAEIAEEDIQQNNAIARHGLTLIKSKYQFKTLNILTHCNAGWLATVDFGTALAPIFSAHDAGLPIHVWVDETRPRNQGASLTAWELAQYQVPHTVIADNAGGHLMQQGEVDLIIVGADRVASNGDVCNKIGTYLKALAAFDNKIPFYVAVPSPTIDWTLKDGKSIKIEARHPHELTHISGLHENGSMQEVRLIQEGTNVSNPAFDVTPSRLVTAIITEKGIFSPKELGSLKNA